MREQLRRDPVGAPGLGVVRLQGRDADGRGDWGRDTARRCEDRPRMQGLRKSAPRWGGEEILARGS